MFPYAVETFSAEEEDILRRYVTNLDQPVFALVNLPEVVKGALFARYSRSPKSLRRLFLDEFVGELDISGDATVDATVGLTRAEELYEKVFFEYGDDSVAQLGGVHLACEQASNVLTKVLEWGRLMAYLEQSTRYIAYNQRLTTGHYRYYRDPGLLDSPLGARYVGDMDRMFDTYGELLESAKAWLAARHPRQPGTPTSSTARRSGPRRSTPSGASCPPPRCPTWASTGPASPTRCSSCACARTRFPKPASMPTDARGAPQGDPLVPAAGGPARPRGRMGRVPGHHPQGDGRARRAALPRPGLAGTLAGGPRAARRSPCSTSTPRASRRSSPPSAPLTDRPEEEVRRRVDLLGAEERRSLLLAYVGDRQNRRHRPGRAFERTGYRFDVVTDYGAFRDLQRHRMLTIEWQSLGTDLGYDVPDVVAEAGLEQPYVASLERSRELAEALEPTFPVQAAYAVALAYRIRYTMQMNAREAMHLVELRSGPQGHPSYRWVAHEMHRLIAEQAGHHLLAEAMSHVEFGSEDLERLHAERRAEGKRNSMSSVGNPAIP